MHVALKRSGDKEEQKKILYFLIDHGALINAVDKVNKTLFSQVMVCLLFSARRGDVM